MASIRPYSRSGYRVTGVQQQLTPYQQSVQWRLKQQQAYKSFRTQAAITASVYSATDSQSRNSIQITAQKTIDRLQKEMQAKLAKQSTALDRAFTTMGKSVDVKA